MSTFDDREKNFEKKFAYDEELQFNSFLFQMMAFLIV